MALDFKLGMDGSQATSQLNVFDAAIKRTGETIRSELGQKLKTAFTVSAIEEVTRRTAQWANEIDRTSKAMGIPPSVLQSIQLLGRTANVADDATTSMFENISKARQQALAGNQEMIKSFTVLGVTLDDLYSKKPSELFGEVVSGVKNVAGPNGISSKDTSNQARQAVQDVTGTPEGTMNAVIGALPGAGSEWGEKLLDKLAAQNPSQVAGDKEVTELSDTWNAFINEFKQMGTSLLPVVTIIVSIFKLVASALGGVVQFFTEILNILGDVVSGQFGKIGEHLANVGSLLVNVIFGIVKAITGLIDFIPNMLNKIPVIGKYFQKDITTGVVQSAQDWTNKKLAKLGADKSTIEHGESVGDVAAIVGTAGEDAAPLLVSSGKLLSKVPKLEKAADLGDKAGNALASASKGTKDILNADLGGTKTVGKGLGVADNGVRSLIGRSDEQQSLKYNEKLAELQHADQANLLKFQTEHIGPFESDEAMRDAYDASDYSKDFEAKVEALGKKYPRASEGPGMAGVRHMGESDTATLATLAKTTQVAQAVNTVKAGLVDNKQGSLDQTPIIPRNSLFQDLGAAGGKTGISYGNAFASGFQSKIIQLNTDMVRYLATIAKNTTYNPGGLLGANSSGNANQTQTGTP